MKAKVPHLHRPSVRQSSLPLTYPRPAEKHSAICSRYKSVVKSSSSSSVPTSDLSTRKKQKDILNKKMTRVGARGSFCNSLWISVTKYCTQSLGRIGETVDIYCVKPGLGYTSGSSSRVSGSWGRSSRLARVKQWDALKPGQTNTFGISCCFFPFPISFSEVGSFEWLPKIYIYFF